MKIPAALVAVALAPAAALADPSVRSQPPVVLPPVDVTAVKTHTLFMGADIAINLDRDLYPVRNVVGNNWVVVIHNEEHEISAKKAPVDLKITPKLKLAEGEATVAGFDRKAAYSFANDPSTRLTRGLTNAGALNGTLIGIQRDAQAKADTASNSALGGAAVFAQGDQQFGAAAMLQTAQTAGAIEHFHPGGGNATGANYTPPVNNQFPSNYASEKLLGGGSVAGYLADQAATSATAEAASASEATGKIASEGMDAMEIDFSISSPRPLRAPYIVTITRFHPAGAKPEVVQNLVYARALDPIDTHLGHVHFTEEGFPFNYEVRDFQLHLYDHGVEIATNIADKHVELTRSEAFEYIKMEYVGAHPDATLDAEPALGKFPAQLPVFLRQGKYAQTFFVRVNKEGVPTASYVDAACKQKVDDAFLESVLQGIWFKPALDHGKPVDGVAPVNLTKLTI